ncbi:MAG: hypothetical protein WC498_03920 [Candidatus Saccharimonadales bacterium]
MRIKNNITNHRFFLLAVCGLLVLVGGLYLSFKHFHKAEQKTNLTGAHSRPVNSVDYGPPSAQQKQAGDIIKQQGAPQTTSGTSSSTSTQQNTITITRLGQSARGGSVTLTTLISNSATGQCVATFSLAGQTTITRTVAIANGPTYYSCEPIDVSSSEFSSEGTWQVTIYVQQGSSIVSNKATGSVTVQK